MVIFHSYVKLPEGTMRYHFCCNLTIYWVLACQSLHIWKSDPGNNSQSVSLGWHDHQMGGGQIHSGKSSWIISYHLLYIPGLIQVPCCVRPHDIPYFSLSLTFKSPWLKSLFTILNSSKLFLVPPSFFFEVSEKKIGKQCAPTKICWFSFDVPIFLGVHGSLGH